MKVDVVEGEFSQWPSVGLRTLFQTQVLAMCLLLGTSIQAAAPINLNSPTDFFTNVAARLLGSELNLDLSHLQIYPTNQYTPAVHRLLQITANIYDSTTNRTLGLQPEYPFCPSVFRPLFRRTLIGTNNCIVIAGYREVKDAAMSDPRLAPQLIDLAQSDPQLEIFPVYGSPFSMIDRNEPMVAGVPLIIGAKKGFPNFNEFSMQTQISVSRLLEFRRPPDSPDSPVVATNQMYVVGVSNTFGLEAWNSYATNYPRDLVLKGSAQMTAVMTNESGSAVFSNTVAQGASLFIPANTWSGWTNLSSAGAASMVLPFGTTNGFLFLTNSTYINQHPRFVPETHEFWINAGFYVPHWWLNLKTRLFFVLVDTNANRIVDYVNLDHCERTLDITTKLAEGNTMTVNPADYRNPANQWITNRLGNSSSTNVATFGIINQIQIGLNGTTDLQSFRQDPYAGLDPESAVDGFRFNLVGAGAIYPKDAGKTFYKSNFFYAPFDPYRSIYVHTIWQANDPFVHYMVSDLVDPGLGETNRVNFISQNPPLSNLGWINVRYSPWGGNPRHANTNDLQMALKDPGVIRSDDWNFPDQEPLDISWIGRVHRGTPWQTIFLKSTNILLQATNPNAGLLTWMRWTGDDYSSPRPNQPGIVGFDAITTAPTNDWHLLGVLNDLLNTKDARQLASPNQSSAEAWETLLDGLTVLTNTAPGEFASMVVTSNSPQAGIIAEALLRSRLAQPGQTYQHIGEILATPELSVASPFLNLSDLRWITDEAMEALPAQLLPLLRPDSIASIGSSLGYPQIQFTGIEGYSYVLQTSSDLMTWTSISTNVIENGSFDFVPSSIDGSAKFYRSLLAP